MSWKNIKTWNMIINISLYLQKSYRDYDWRMGKGLRFWLIPTPRHRCHLSDCPRHWHWRGKSQRGVGLPPLRWTPEPPRRWESHTALSQYDWSLFSGHLNTLYSQDGMKRQKVDTNLHLELVLCFLMSTGLKKYILRLRTVSLFVRDTGRSRHQAPVLCLSDREKEEWLGFSYTLLVPQTVLSSLYIRYSLANTSDHWWKGLFKRLFKRLLLFHIRSRLNMGQRLCWVPCSVGCGHFACAPRASAWSGK